MRVKHVLLFLLFASFLFAQNPTAGRPHSRATFKARTATLPAPRSVIVVMNAPAAVEMLTKTDPAANHARIFSAEGRDLRQALRQAKAPLVARIATRGLEVRAQTETVLNAVMIADATPEDLEWLRAQPEVKSARVSGRMHVMMDAAANLVGAPQVWSQTGGQDQTGRGVKIALIDSGIDVLHPMLSDSGFAAPPGFPCFDNSTNQKYTNNKVIVAKNYVCPLTGDCIDFFDPLDRQAGDGLGHGTFTASIAGGRSAAAPDGATIAGIAPGAFLGNYKVFSSLGSGEDSAILTALEDAVNDGMDIISFSGGGGGTTAFVDLYSEVTQNIAALGIVTVVAAGNCGPFGDCQAGGDASMSSPGLLPEVIAAGASTNSHMVSPVLQILGPVPPPANLQAVTFFASGVSPISKTIGPVTLADGDRVDSTQRLCRAATSTALQGVWALVELTDACDTDTQIGFASRAGALGVIFYDNFDEPLFDIFDFTTNSSIPSVYVTLNDGVNLTNFLAQNSGVTVQLNPFTVLAQKADQVSDYSSRGPTADFLIKPDLVAPGDMLGAVETIDPNGQFYDASGFLYAAGTSLATPMISGAAAAIKQAHPGYAPHDVRSALSGTASPISATQDGALISVMNSGGGRLNIPAAIATTLVSDPAAVSFGMTSLGTAPVNMSAAVKLKCTGTVSETFSIAATPSVNINGVTWSTDKSTVTLAAGATATINVTLAAAGQSQGISEGFVVLKSTSTATTLRIPFWVMLGRPTLGVNGVVDAASFGPKIAPGEMISVFGSSIGGAGVGATAIPLPYELNHAQILLLGRADFPSEQYGGDVFGSLPLFFDSAGQANVQLPLQMTPNRYAWIISTVQGIQSNAVTFQVVTAAPAIFTATANGVTSGIVLHANYQPVTSSSPAAPGEVVTVYCTGLGDVTPQPNLGTAAPASPVSTTVAATTASVAGQTASVQFSGLAPLYVGLYQVNVQIPSGVASGPQSLTISAAGATSKPVTTFIK